MMAILKKYLTGVGIIALAFSYNIGQANSTECVMPTCDALGYTTAKSACNLRTYLTCPFDTTQVYCPDCSSYPLSKAKCNSAYGTCEACPYSNSKYKYSACKTGKELTSDGLCRCKRSTYQYKYVEDDGSTRAVCTDDTGSYTTNSNCWTNAKVVSGDACVRVKLNVGDIFTWGGAPLGLVINDDGVNITIAGMFYIDNSATETGDSSGFNTGVMTGSSVSNISNQVVYYIPSVCTVLSGSPLRAPASYREGSPTDLICEYQSSNGKWRLPNATEAMKMRSFVTTPGTLGYAFANSGSSAGTATWYDYVFYKIGGSSNMNKWFPTRAPSNWGDITMLDTEFKCNVSASLNILPPLDRDGTIICDLDGDNDYDVKVQALDGSISNTSLFPVRPVMTIAIP